MGSESSDSVGESVDISTSSCTKKKNPAKVPKKIHKAEREKLKRNHMNDLFLDLGKALGVEHPNNGKALILSDTVRLLGEMITQVDTLRKENVALLSESKYIMVEKNELVEETSALDKQVKLLQSQIDERTNFPNAGISNASVDHLPLPIVGHAPDSTPIMGPVFIMPLHHEVQPEVFTCQYTDDSGPKFMSSVSRPRPRYPSSSDIWPSHILAKPTNVTEDV